MAQIMEELMTPPEFEQAQEVKNEVVAEEAPAQETEEVKSEEPKAEENTESEDTAKEVDLDITPIMAGGLSDSEADEEDEEEEDSFLEQEWEVSCPTCSKVVKTQPGSLYHRCPSCQKVFELQKQTKTVEDEVSEEAVEEPAQEETTEANENNE